MAPINKNKIAGSGQTLIKRSTGKGDEYILTDNPRYNKRNNVRTGRRKRKDR